MTRGSKTTTSLLAAAGMAALAVAVGSGQQAPAPVYTAAQATAGRAAYDANCASCHMPDLGGRNEAPQLAGGNFMNTWRTRTTQDLFELMRGTMPPDGPTLSDDQYLAIASYVLQSNGAPAGAQAFSGATSVAIGSVATGQAPQLAAGGSRRRARRTRRPRGRRTRGPRRARRPRARARPHRRRPHPELRARHRPDAAQSVRRRLADGAPELPGLELQPAVGGHDVEREEPAPGVGVGDERGGRRERADADRARRDHVPEQSRQHDAGARREDRRPALGKPRRPRGAGRHRGHAQHRDLPGQGLHGHDRRAPRRARRAHGEEDLGRRVRRPREG